MKTYLEFINEKSVQEPDYGCLMVYFNTSGWSEFVDGIVDKNDLYLPKGEESKYGYCHKQHITVLYGFHKQENIVKDIKELLIPIKELDDITMKDISIFENEEFDVVKIDIESKKLHKLNKLMSDNFEYTNEFKEYHPHMTIAYVKKGKGKKYEQSLNDKSIKPNRYVYSSADRKKTTIKK